MATSYGFVETRGFIGAAQATDALHKAANVRFAHREDIGSGLVTTVCTGDVGAVRAAIAAGEQAAREAGEFHASHVIPNLHAQVQGRILGKEPCGELPPNMGALGLVECLGYTAMIEAADAAVKAARVEIVDSRWVGGGYAAVLFRGDVAACQAAAEAGAAGAERLGRVIARHVIPAPHPSLFDVLPLGPKPAGAKAETPEGDALGFIEVRGCISLVEAADAAVKAARVVPIGWQKVGSALVSIIVQGEVAAVRSAVAAGQAAAARIVAEKTAGHVIPRPNEALNPFMAAKMQKNTK